MVSVISFFIGLTLVSLLWQIISDGVGVVIYVFNQFIEFLNYYLTRSIDVSKLANYVFSPVENIISTLNEIISYLLVIAQFAFVVGTLAKKNINVPVISKYVNNVLNYITATDSIASAEVVPNNVASQGFNGSNQNVNQTNNFNAQGANNVPPVNGQNVNANPQFNTASDQINQQPFNGNNNTLS